jgi:MFS family permease
VGWRLLRLLLALGLIAAFANMMEDIGATWSAVYLRDSLGSGPAVAGFGFIALQASQTVGRFVGDPLVTRFGDRTVARIGAGLAFVGMLVAIVVPTPAVTVVAFGVVGAGIGTIIPGALRMAESTPGVATGTGIVWVNTTIAVGLLISPPLVGFLADVTTLTAAVAVIPVVAVGVLLLSRVMGAREAGAQGP